MLRATSLSTLEASEGTNWPLRARETFFTFTFFIVITKSGEALLIPLLGGSLRLRISILILDLLAKLEHGIAHA